MTEQITEITDGLRFPEGPVWMPDETLLCVELLGGTVVRVQPDGKKEIVSENGGSPNGLAIGPDGAAYVCNNGGFEWLNPGGINTPGNQSADYLGGSIQRVVLDGPDAGVAPWSADTITRAPEGFTVTATTSWRCASV